MKKEKEKDKCVRCGEKTVYSKDAPVESREYYVEGAGQLCPECFRKIYDK